MSALHLSPPLPDTRVLPTRLTMIPTVNRGRRRGVGQSNINPTTIWDPQHGWNINSPGSTAGPAVYQAPQVIPPPACTQDTQPGGAAFSSGCIAQLLATQQQNLAAGTAANYNVDLQNCLNTFPQPPDCYQRTFGLTLPGTTGGASGDIANAAALLGDPAAAALAAEGAHNPPTPTPQPQAPTPTPQTQSPSTGGGTTQQPSGGVTTGGGGTTNPIPTWYWIAGLAAAGLLIFVAVQK